MRTHTLCDGQARVAKRDLLARAENGSSNTAIYTLWRDLAPFAMTGPSSVNYVVASYACCMLCMD